MVNIMRSLLQPTVFFLFALCTSASSLIPRDVDGATLANFQFFSQFATAAYCKNNNVNGANNVPISCPGSTNCGQIVADGVKTVLQFTGNTGPNLITDTNGFVAVDDAKKLIVVAFRGTHGFRNIVDDLRFVLVDASDILCKGCWVNAGFLASYKVVRMAIYNTVLAAYKTKPGYQVVVTGHSLGGALATLAAADLRNLNTLGPIDLYTYGAPRSGNPTLTSYIASQAQASKGRNFRITHKRDPVPRVPPRTAGFDHVYPQYFISADTDVAVTARDISLSYGCCNSGDDVFLLADGPLDISAHLWYFTSISACGGEAITPQGVTGMDLEPITNGTAP